MRTFESLECYRRGVTLRRKISELCKTLPKEERYMLCAQIVRSSRSVTANIAEGFGRHHHSENLQIFRVARGSLTETLDHLNTARDEDYLSEGEYIVIRELLSDVWKILNGYISYIKKCVQEGAVAKNSLINHQLRTPQLSNHQPST